MSAPQGPLENPEVRFEVEDIRATPVLKFLVGLAITCVVVALLLVVFYRGMRSYVAGLQPPPPHMKFEEARRARGSPPAGEAPARPRRPSGPQEDAIAHHLRLGGQGPGGGAHPGGGGDAAPRRARPAAHRSRAEPPPVAKGKAK